jgi:hypothetical protein
MKNIKWAAAPLKVEIRCSGIQGRSDAFILVVDHVLNFEAKRYLLTKRNGDVFEERT